MKRTEIIYGVNPVLEALRSGRRRCHEIFLARGKKESGIENLKVLAAKKGVSVREVDRAHVDGLVKGTKHQGVAAQVDVFFFSDMDEVVRAALSDDQKGFILILDGVTDPHNLGSILRTAHLMGVHGVVIPRDNSATVNATVVKTSAGATEYVRIVQVTNIVREIEFLKEKGFWIAAADEKSTDSIYQHDFIDENVVLVFGGEGKGIRRLAREKCDFLLSIPMDGAVGSYNASVAGAIFMAEVARQRWVKAHANSVPK